MNHDMPNARFIVISILIMLATAWVLIRYARACLCDSCKDPYAIFGRGELCELQLCRQCKIVYDRKYRSLRRVLEPPGEWHFGIWKTARAFSLRLFKWAFVWSRP